MQNELRGMGVALVTPFTVDGAIDFDALKRLVEYQIANGTDYLVVLGTTAETPTLTEQEKHDVIQTVVSVTKGRVPLVLGMGGNNTQQLINTIRHSEFSGIDALLSVTPYYNKPSDEGIYRHFEAVSKVGMPIIVYNIAGRTGKNISTSLLCRIVELPNIAGVKEASGDINQMMDVIAKISRKKPEFSVLSGDDGLTLPLIAAGGDGVISVVSNIAPSLVTELVTKAIEGKFDEARDIHYRLLPFFKAAFVDGNPTSIKYAMNYKGLPAGGLRLPLVEVHEEAKKIIEKALKECNL